MTRSAKKENNNVFLKFLLLKVLPSPAILYISYLIINSNHNLYTNEFISYSKLLDIHMIFIGLAVTILAFLYSISQSIKQKVQAKAELNHESAPEGINSRLLKLMKVIGKDTFRIIISFIVLLLFMLLECPLFSALKINDVDLVSCTIRLASLFYIIINFIDVTIPTVVLCNFDINAN